MTIVGELALWVALFLVVWAGAASLSGRALRRPELAASSVRAIYAAAVMVTPSPDGFGMAFSGRF